MAKKTDYLKIIHKYIPPSSLAYSIYMPHVTLVTAKALAIGRKLKLRKRQLRFIEEAAMLHDIGIVHVRLPEIGCYGEMPYIYHVVEGRKILEAEGLPAHGRIAENHLGVGGLTAAEIIKNKLPLPPKDMLAQTLEEKIISYADLFFSKNPERLFMEKSLRQVKMKVNKYGKRQQKLFKEWHKMFQ